MKKFILPIILAISFLFFLPQNLNAQTDPDCRKLFDKESYKCLTDFNACQAACSEKTKKPDGTIYFNSGEIYTKCIKESDCSGKSSACSEQALVNFRACGKSDNQPAEAKKETPKQDGIRALVGTHETYDAARGIYINLDSFYGIYYETTIEEITEGKPGKGVVDLLSRTPLITKEDEEKAWEVFLPIYIPSEENITVIKGQGEIKSPTSPQFIPIGPKGGDTVQVTYLDSTVRATSDAVQLRYTWSADSGAVIDVPKRTEIKFQKPVEVEGFTSHTVELGQGEIEVKLRNDKPAENQFGVDAGWLGVTASRTHFWVSQSQDKKMAVVGVYEGEVEIKTKDGKTIKVSPDRDKPGVVIISQKPSVIKLAVIGAVLVVVIAGVTMIFRRKFTPTGFSKKKK